VRADAAHARIAASGNTVRPSSLRPSFAEAPGSILAVMQSNICISAQFLLQSGRRSEQETTSSSNRSAALTLEMPTLNLKPYQTLSCNPLCPSESRLSSESFTLEMPTGRTSTDLLPCTMSTGELLMGPVHRCCSRSRACSRPNSTSAYLQGGAKA